MVILEPYKKGSMDDKRRDRRGATYARTAARPRLGSPGRPGPVFRPDRLVHAMADNSLFITSFLALAAIIALVLLAFSIRAYRFSGNRAFLFLIAAFALAVVKSGVVAWSVRSHLIGHGELEVFDAAADMTILLLIAAPFLLPGRRG